jgi:hypothetical protein
MKEFKVGDRVAAYTGKTNYPDAIRRAVGEIAQIAANGAILLKHDTLDYWYSPKQCRRLIKRERRRVWVNPKYQSLYHGSECVFRDEPRDGFVEFIEVRKK